MKLNLTHFCSVALLGAALTIPMALAPTALLAQDQRARSYHDKDHNDDHEWNAHENQAYRMYNKQNHRKNVEFSTLHENDQQAYWGWRHEHSDAQLKIVVH
jgi:hypothetical protein